MLYDVPAPFFQMFLVLIVVIDEMRIIIHEFSLFYSTNSKFVRKKITQLIFIIPTKMKRFS